MCWFLSHKVRKLLLLIFLQSQEFGKSIKWRYSGSLLKLYALHTFWGNSLMFVLSLMTKLSFDSRSSSLDLVSFLIFLVHVSNEVSYEQLLSIHTFDQSTSTYLVPIFSPQSETRKLLSSYSICQSCHWIYL